MLLSAALLGPLPRARRLAFLDGLASGGGSAPGGNLLRVMALAGSNILLGAAAGALPARSTQPCMRVLARLSPSMPLRAAVC